MPVGCNLRYDFCFHVGSGLQDDFGYVTGLFPNHVANFEFVRQKEQAEGGAVYQLTIGRLLSRTTEDVVYTAVAWLGNFGVKFGLVRAPLVICPISWGAMSSGVPYFGTTTSVRVCQSVMTHPLRNHSIIRLLLPFGHPRPLRQDIGYMPTPILYP